MFEFKEKEEVKMQEIVEMSKKELDRHMILEKILDKQISQKKGAQLLNLSDRQVRNLLSNYKTHDVNV